MTHFRTSVTALGTDTQLLSATQLITRPGTLPTVTIPVFGGRQPDADRIWRYLREPAEFFGIPMPGPSELMTALTEILDGSDGSLIAATLAIVEDGPGSRIVAWGTAVQPLRSDSVRITRDDSVPHAHGAADPWWRRMAARTTSRGELDQCERWLNGRGYADALSGGVPILGALVFETRAGVVGVENPEPTSVLDQLVQCGLIDEIAKVSVAPACAERAWWVSPRYETHPVVELDGARFATEDETVPSFGRWS